MNEHGHAGRTGTVGTTWPLLLGGLLLLGGCREIGVTTRISPDGSLERIEELVQDDDDSGETAWILPDGPGWEHSATTTDSTGKRHTVWSRAFTDASALDADLAARPAEGIALCSRVSLERRRGLFSTTYEWRESLPSVFPFSEVPLTSWFSPEEIRLIQEGEADSTLSERAEEWQIANLMEHFYRLLVEESERSGLTDPGPARIEAEKDRLLEVWHGAEDDIDPENAGADLLRLSRPVLGPHTDRLQGVAEAFERDFEPFASFTDRAGGESHTFTVVMPGQILDTNAEEVVGSRVSWQDSAERALYGDAVMTAVSRVTHTGRLIVVLVVALALIGLTFVLVARRRL